MEIPVSFQLLTNPLAYSRIALAFMGNLPIEAKGIPGIG